MERMCLGREDHPGLVHVHPRGDYRGAGCTLTLSAPTNPVTGRRYAKHCGMSTDELAQYVRENVRTARLSRAQTFTMYFVTRSGRVASRMVRLGKGESVFVQPGGKVLIAIRCGNPVSRKRCPEVVKEQPVEVPSGATSSGMLPELMPAEWKPPR